MRRFWLILAVLLIPYVTAQYYADITFDVGADGTVSVTGISNHPDLQERVTQEFTSKTKERWLINATLPGTFDEAVFKIVLPRDATINYIAAKGAFTIGSEGGRVTVTRVDSNTTIGVVVQYVVQPKTNASLVWLVLAVLLLLAAGLWWRRKKPLKKLQAPTLSHIDGLPERQKEILTLLKKAGGQLTQRQIEQNMNIPKSSVSRNLDSLERRGLIRKETYGMTNIVKLT